MGKSCRKHPCRLDEAIQAVHEDTLFETSDIDVLMKSLIE